MVQLPTRRERLDAATRRQQLQEALRRADLHELAGRPLLLTVMTQLHTFTGDLPDDHGQLYAGTVNLLLQRWESRHDQGAPLLQQQAILGLKMSDVEAALYDVAYRAHMQQAVSSEESVTADIDEGDLRQWLAAYLRDDWNKAGVFIAYIRERAGLLIRHKTDAYTFPHRTFQEYLAARWLATGDFLAKFSKKLPDEQWRERWFRALGFQVSVQSKYDNALGVLHELLPEAPMTESDWRAVLLLGDACVRLLGPQRTREAEQQRRARDVVRDVPERLTAAMQNPALPPSQRLDAGLLLADLDVDPPGQDDFVTAPGWKFKIARYPVTNKQFCRFVDAGGYRDDRWWQDKDGRRYRDEDPWTEPRYWDNAELNQATQPVVGVSWYEANAYCAWLTAQLRTKGELLDQEHVRLPTVAEWEQAAHSGAGDYPWGENFVAANANTEESDLNQTTPVHMYPDGATPEGVFDLSGNV